MLLPDPTTAASERSSIKSRLTGSRRRGSGINRQRSRTVSLRVQGVQGQECPQHESTQPGLVILLPQKTRVRHKNRDRSKQSAKRVVQHSANGGPEQPGLSRGVQGLPGRSRAGPGAVQTFALSEKKNGSGCPLSVPAVAHPPPAISRCHPRVGGYIHLRYIYILQYDIIIQIHIL